MATRKRRTEMATAGATPQEADLTKIPVPANPDEHICKIPESQHLFISLTGKAFERALLSRLDWMSYLYVGPAHPCIKSIGSCIQSIPVPRKSDQINCAREPMRRIPGQSITPFSSGACAQVHELVLTDHDCLSYFVALLLISFSPLIFLALIPRLLLISGEF